MFRKILAILIGLDVIGCASRVQPAPIENMTNVPAYVKSTPANTVAPTGTANVATSSSSSNKAANTATQVSALSDNRSTAPSAVSNNTVIQAKKSSPAAPVANNTIVVSSTGDSNSSWVMPTDGKSSAYTATSKGINIYGKDGQPIVAINDGKVVYSGNGLKGYGNLIIIKHNDSYLSAYAHNKANLVKEGAQVKKGQQIATMGTDDSGKFVLHLEVRKNGKPVDPFSVIQAK